MSISDSSDGAIGRAGARRTALDDQRAVPRLHAQLEHVPARADEHRAQLVDREAHVVELVDRETDPTTHVAGREPGDAHVRRIGRDPELDERFVGVSSPVILIIGFRARAKHRTPFVAAHNGSTRFSTT